MGQFSAEKPVPPGSVLTGNQHSALMSSGIRTLFGSPTTVVSALKVGSPHVFVGNDNGYSAMASDCNVELHKNMGLISRFDNASDGNVVQCGEIGERDGERRIPANVANYVPSARLGNIIFLAGAGPLAVSEQVLGLSRLC